MNSFRKWVLKDVPALTAAIPCKKAKSTSFRKHRSRSREIMDLDRDRLLIRDLDVILRRHRSPPPSKGVCGDSGQDVGRMRSRPRNLRARLATPPLETNQQAEKRTASVSGGPGQHWPMIRMSNRASGTMKTTTTWQNSQWPISGGSTS
ncbi:hypothetical protein pipiens_011046 [Culex pipiens pipiens]|uniref:Uncharacterized protein n=1 Tax=Culex pipiens pipiens TaxID=38569 RepID=A0ABD1D7V3_CULPP